MNGLGLNLEVDVYYGDSKVKSIYYGSTKVWPIEAHNYYDDYFTIRTNVLNNVILVADSGVNKDIDILYRINGGLWQNVTLLSGVTTTIATLSSVGDTLELKGSTYTSWALSPDHTNKAFISSGSFDVYGNILSLLYGDNFNSNLVYTINNYLFKLLFYNSNIRSARNLILKCVSYACYNGMFEGCTNLIKAPELPATTTESYCYRIMFKDCTSLLIGPSLLSAENVKTLSYYSMFLNCSSLIEGPSIMAKDISSSAFGYMFDGCTSLKEAPSLSSIETLTGTNVCVRMFLNCISLVTAKGWITKVLNIPDYTYLYMFSGCTSLVNIPNVILATTMGYYACGNMFRNCSSLVIAPELPATTIGDSCYNTMFYQCTNLIKAPSVLPAQATDSCYNLMFSGCKSITLAPQIKATNAAYRCFRQMFLGCTSLVSALELPATVLYQECYQQMYYGCTSLIKAPSILPATTLATSCYNAMFRGCTNLTTAPVLPAKTLVEDCMTQMFYGCSKLNYIKALFTTTPDSSYTLNWVANVASSGTFIKNEDAIWTTTGNHAVPTNWTVLTCEEDDYSYPNSL